jgi:hypothetical protein
VLLREEVESLLTVGDKVKLAGMRAEAGARLREIDSQVGVLIGVVSVYM